MWAEVDNTFSFIFASYGQDLSDRDSDLCRNLIKSDWYVERYGRWVQMEKANDNKRYFKLEGGGSRRASSIGGAMTGYRADAVVIDDPLKAEDCDNVTEIEKANEWYQTAAYNRVNSAEHSIRVIIMQRLHVEDMSELAKSVLDFGELIVPQEYDEETSTVSCLGYHDPRKVNGELAFPARFNDNFRDEMIKAQGQRKYDSQYQQSPTIIGGGLFKREHWRYANIAPEDVYWVRYWDCAATEVDTNPNACYSAGVKLGYSKRTGAYYIDDVIRDRVGPRALENLIQNTAEQDGRAVKVFMEQEPGASGKSVIHYYKTRVLRGFFFDGDLPSGDKVIRAEPLASQQAAFNVYLINGDWNRDFIDECTDFPNGRYKDQVDAASGAFKMILEFTKSFNEMIIEQYFGKGGSNG